MLIALQQKFILGGGGEYASYHCFTTEIRVRSTELAKFVLPRISSGRREYIAYDVGTPLQQAQETKCAGTVGKPAPLQGVELKSPDPRSLHYIIIKLSTTVVLVGLEAVICS